MNFFSLNMGRTTLTAFLPFSCLLILGMRGASADEIRIGYVMDSEPAPFEWEELYADLSPKFLRLWMGAFRHNEVDLRREMLEAIERAHRMGEKNFGQTIEPIMALFEEAEQHPTLRLSAAKTLITLDARQSAELLWKCAEEDGRSMTLLVEPALARWDYQPVRNIWLSRLEDRETPHHLLKLAIQGLAVVQEKKAVPEMKHLVLDVDAHPGIRLAAARSVAVLLPRGLERDAAGLIAAEGPGGLLDRLLGATLISSHRGASAESMLKKLALDPLPAVATVALKRLMEIDPEMVAVLAPRILGNPDSNVRDLAAHSLVARPSVERIGSIATMLDDPHPRIRKYVSASLVQLAGEKRFDDAVRAGGMDMLATDRWRGLEQASLVLAMLDHKPAADRLMALLDFERSEVYIAAAWALRKLKIPETLPRMFLRAEGIYAETKGPQYENLNYGDADFQVGHLYEAFGLLGYHPVEGQLRKAIPKNSAQGIVSRASAIWALGYLYQGKADPKLSKAFAGRLADVGSPEPEEDRVRRAAAISLGRMKSKNELKTLRKFAENEGVGSLVGHACYWAIQQITNEPIPDLESGGKIQRTGNWILSPLDVK